MHRTVPGARGGRLARRCLGGTAAGRWADAKRRETIDNRPRRSPLTRAGRNSGRANGRLRGAVPVAPGIRASGAPALAGTELWRGKFEWRSGFFCLFGELAAGFLVWWPDSLLAGGAAFVGQAVANCASLAPTWRQDAATRAGPAPSEALARWMGRGADEYR